MPLFWGRKQDGAAGGKDHQVHQNTAGTDPDDHWNSKLVQAAKDGDKHKVKLALKNGADVNFWDPNNYSSALQNAIGNKDIEIVKILLAAKANPNKGLVTACRSSSVEILKLLEEHGGELSQVKHPLHRACYEANYEVVEYLLNKGFDPNSRIGYDTPLHGVVAYATNNPVDSRVKVCNLLLERGADIHATTGYGQTALHMVCSGYCGDDNVDFVKYLLSTDLGNDLSLKDDGGKTVFDLAADKPKMLAILKAPKASIPKKETDAESEFFTLFWDCQKRMDDPISVYAEHQKLVKAVCNVPTFALYYSFLCYCVSQGVLDDRRARELLAEVLSFLAKLCVSEDALVRFKLILAKCKSDGLLSDDLFHRLDNRAEEARTENSDFILDMRASIQRNADKILQLEGRMDNAEKRLDALTKNIENVTKNIETLQGNIVNVNSNLGKLKKAMRFKMRVEAGVSVVKGVLNAVSMGIAGEFASVFAFVANNVIDFGDAAHIKTVIADAASCCNTGELTAIQEHFQQGIEMAENCIDSAAEQRIEKEMEAAIQEGSPMVAIAFMATVSKKGAVFDLSNCSSSPLTDPVKPKFEVWKDAVFDEELEDESLELHFAVKYGDGEALEETLADASDKEELLKRLDSQGRTAADLAALTGQVDLMAFLERHGCKFSQPKAKMRATGKKRAPMSTEYIRHVESSL